MEHSTNLLNKYINGEDIEESLLNELENNSEFMKKAIFLSNDKNLYELCSESVKTDYDFVLFLINKFNSDEKFICDVADYYLNNSDNNTKCLELAIIMSDLLKESDNSIKYDSIVKEKYYSIKKTKDVYLKKNPDSESIVGLGFIFAINTYYESDVVIKYFAKRIIDELIQSNEFESYVHKSFKSFEEFKQNINNNIINYISMYDTRLSRYTAVNISLLLSMDSSIKRIQNNWKKYDKQLENKKYFILVDALQYYLIDHDNGRLGEYLMIHYVSEKMGILDKVVKFTHFNYDEVINQLKKIDVDNIIKNSIPDRINFINCREIIENIIFKGNLKYEFHSESNKINKCKIIKLK